MKLTQSLLVMTIAAGTVWAQAQAPAVKPAPKPGTPATASAKPAPAQTNAKSSGAAVAPAKNAPVAMAQKPAAAPVKPATPVKKAAVVERKGKAKPAVKKSEERAEVAKGSEVEAPKRSGGKLRDPFVSPIVRASGPGGPICETGKRCLMVDQILLKGIVKSQNGFIAVVENAAHRAYFLRENDPVFNGTVVKITQDTVVFRESTTDKVGKQSSREVVKKVNAPVV